MRLSSLAVLPEHAETAVGVLDHSFALFRRCLKRCTLLLTMGLAPISLLEIVFANASLIQAMFGGNFGSMFKRYFWLVPVWLGAYLWLAAMVAALIYILGVRARGRDLTLMENIRFGLREALRLFFLTILSILLMVIGFVLGGIWMYGVGSSFAEFMGAAERVAIIGPILNFLIFMLMFTPFLMILAYFAIPVTLAPCALILLRQGVFASIGSGFVLMGKHFWRSTLIISVPSLLLMAGGIVLGSLAAYLQFSGFALSYGTLTKIIIELLTLPLQVVLWPLIWAATVVLFADLLVRREGRDLQAQLKQLTSA
jgi:hypothetical protein